jgi:UDP-N-acetylglucosamine 2-epimerase (non-hydrolysing)
LTVLEPLAGDEFLALAAEAALLVSDSGGVQEEATVLGLPLVVVRRSTERPEAFETFATLVRPEAIAKASAAILAGGTHLRRALASTPSPYGDGTASRSIVEEVRSRFGRPTAVSAPANASEGRPVATAYGARHARRSSDSHSPAVTKSATGNSPALSAP